MSLVWVTLYANKSHQCVVVYCSVSQCVAVCCSVLLCVAVCCSVLCHMQTSPTNAIETDHKGVGALPTVFWDVK